jgi:hypothetical protein
MMESKRSIPELSVDSQVLMKRLAGVAVGETVTYTELSTLIGRNVQTSARGYLTTARRRLKRDDQMVFAAVQNLGVKRLDDLGLVQAGQSGMEHVRNHTRRVVQTLGCVAGYAALPPEVQRAYNLTTAQAGMLLHVTKPAVVKQIEAHLLALADAVPAKFLEAVKQTL